MKKGILLAVAFVFMTAPLAFAGPKILVKSPKKLYCHAAEMKKALEHSNRNFNGTIVLDVFCQNGKIKYVSTTKGSGVARYVPDGHPVYRICGGNPCK